MTNDSTSKHLDALTLKTRLPNILFRFFDNEDHARRFIGGEIRFGLLDYYRTVEGCRKDESEGLVSFSWTLKAPQIMIDKPTGEVVGHAESNQNIRYRGFSLNPYFILCTSHPKVDHEF